MDLELQDKVAIVGGASKGLGRACAEVLAQDGVKVAICSRTKADLEQAIKSKRTSWLGGMVFGLMLGLAILFVLGPRQFFSLLGRAFSPFVEASIATRTKKLI